MDYDINWGIVKNNLIHFHRMSMLEILREASVNLNSKAEKDERLNEFLKEKERTVVIQFTDGNSYILNVKDGRMQDPIEGTMDEPTLFVKTDVETFKKILDKELNPLMAYAMKKIKFKGPLEDIMLLKDIF